MNILYDVWHFNWQTELNDGIRMNENEFAVFDGLLLRIRRLLQCTPFTEINFHNAHGDKNPRIKFDAPFL